MIAFIYRWRIRSGLEDEFRTAWRELTQSIYESYGSLGSRLHRASDGTFIAYAQWPSAEQREAARVRGSANPGAAARMRSYIEQEYEEMQLAVMDDLLKANLQPTK